MLIYVHIVFEYKFLLYENYQTHSKNFAPSPVLTHSKDFIQTYNYLYALTPYQY
jgi:hypothetical protein